MEEHRPSRGRLPAIDWLRGLVMVLMAIDHANTYFSNAKLMADSAYMNGLGADLLPGGSVAPFLTRWITHLCAPTFVFLAGTSVALSESGRRQAGQPDASFTRHLLLRGSLLIVLEVLVCAVSNVLLLQVLYAIGASMICLAFLRRLSTRWILGLGLAGIFGLELVVEALGFAPGGGDVPVWGAALLAMGVYPIAWAPDFFYPVFLFLYPLLPWLAVMLVGFALGRWLGEHREDPEVARRAARLLWWWGLAALALFVTQRVVNGYGNFGLERTDGSLLHWLQVSKYPPSFAFTALELGIMALLLAGFLRLQERWGGRIRSGSPLLVFGQTALFFYLLHLPLMLLFRMFVLGRPYFDSSPNPFGLSSAYVGAAGALLVLYPLCRWFRSYRRRHPESWVRLF